MVHRLVIRPLQRLTAEADALAAAGAPARSRRPTRPAELDRLAARYRAMAEDLLDVQSHVVRVEKLAGIGRLAAGVAHEVRNPLGALGTYVEVLQRRGTDPAVTGEMRRAIERIERIVQGLVDYARPGEPSAQPIGDRPDRSERRGSDGDGVPGRAGHCFRDHAVEIALADRSALACAATEHRAGAGGRQPGGQRLPGHARGAWRSARSTALETPRARHADEAAHATESPALDRRPRRLDLAPELPGVLLYVADDGPGVPEADRERIFDPFFTTKDPGEGTGLGLAIVARTVHESGGVVWVDRAREGGAVFKVFLPLAGETDAAADR